ncbi:hypothetical protein ACFLZW_04730, partial [Chloroflexota bacterium]
QVVLLGKIMNYYVIDWLPIYNFIVGIISAFAAIIIWKDSKIAMPAAIAVLASHVAVMLVLLTAYREVVASDSIKAMTVRIVAWIIIIVLMIFQARRDKSVPS